MPPKPPPLQYYRVIVNGTVPTEIEYKILAETPEAALAKIPTSTPVAFRTTKSLFKRIGSVVYRPFSSLILLTKKG